jgi:pyruvate,water dikinase
MSAVIWFGETRKEHVGIVGGKAANLGELISAGIPVPPGFTVPAVVFSEFIRDAGLGVEIYRQLDALDVDDSAALDKCAEEIRRRIMQAHMPDDVAASIRAAYGELSSQVAVANVKVAVRSSATAEDLPEASFAGQQATFLNVSREEHVVRAVQACWASLFEARAIFYRAKNNFDHRQVALAVVVQMMVQSAKSGVMFTINSVTGNPGQLEISAVYGLGEALVSGTVNADTYVLNKQTLAEVSRVVEPQQEMLVYVSGHSGDPQGANRYVPVPAYMDVAPVLTDEQIRQLAEIGLRVERHYGRAQDIEWAFQDGRFYLTQARPVTVLAQDYLLEETAPTPEPDLLLMRGQAASPGIGVGKVRILRGPHECDRVQAGDVLVAEMTTPDYVAAMKRAVAVVTVKGGRTCHAAIVARELGIPCIVGVNGALDLRERLEVTVDGSHGELFRGAVASRIVWGKQRLARLEAKKKEMAAMQTRTKVMVILADPDEAPRVAAENVDGVGLLRMEFLLARIGGHPKWFLKRDDAETYIARLGEGIGGICAAFGDRPVVLRLLDFKTNELEHLTGGAEFEKDEENPMLGLRGAARYMQQPEVFKLELEAIKRVRQAHKNLWVMVPFVRTVPELEWVLRFMADNGLERSQDFQVWMMAEVPSNVFLLDKFIAAGIDGISIGSNDLTQLILGIDRDNPALTCVGDERDPAVMIAMEHIVRSARAIEVTVSICGQGPSDFPEIAEALVDWGATSVSVSPDRIAHTREVIHRMENS